MKKRILSCLMALTLCLSLLPTAALASDGAWDGSIATAFAGGTGTESDPYQIADGAQLAYLASEVNKGQTYENSYFVLTADIDLAKHDWTPIGNSFSGLLFRLPDYSLFAGNLDGKGHTISNISIGTESSPLESDVFGLFGATSGKISNLNLDGVTIHGTSKNVSGYVIGLSGALAGFAGGSIENCHVTNLSMTMNTPDSGWTAAYWIGGLVGILDESKSIEECSAAGTIKELSGKGSIGGLIGELGRAAKITYSHADVALDVESDSRGGADVGGLIGKGNGKTDAETIIRNCYATGNVTGGAYTGGFAGGLWGLNIKNCYASGNVSQAAVAMASFVGTDASDSLYYGSITNCFTTGSVTGSSPFQYAFAEQSSATKRSKITNCYFAVENLGIKNQNESATEMSQDEMKNEAFAATLNGSDDSNGWSFVNGQVLCGAEPADYSAVEAAMAAIPTDLTVYTDESVAALNTAVDGVVRGKAFVSQANVNAMAQAIEDAIAALQYKGADYTKFIEAIAAFVTKVETSPFSDVSTSAYYYEAVKWAQEKGITGGIGNGLFGPNQPCTRAQIVTFLWRAAGSPVVNYAMNMSDVPEGSYYAEAVRWALSEGIATGTTGNTFSPDSECTRAQAVAFLFRYAASEAVTLQELVSGFSDADSVPGYALPAMNWALAEEIVQGNGSKLMPNDSCTRAQIVTFLFRAYQDK